MQRQTLSLELNKGRHLTNEQSSKPAAGALVHMPLSQPTPGPCSCHRLPAGTGGSDRRQTVLPCAHKHTALGDFLSVTS